MKILDQALSIEQEGARFYRALAKQSSDEGVIYIFSWLASQEEKHYTVFQKMKKGAFGAIDKDQTSRGVVDVFKAWKDSGERLDVKTPQVELYRKALAVEEESIKLYAEGARSASHEEAKAIFLWIAAEEKMHREIMENMIEFITKPDSWAENAEFGYRGAEYYL